MLPLLAMAALGGAVGAGKEFLKPKDQRDFLGGGVQGALGGITSGAGAPTMGAALGNFGNQQLAGMGGGPGGSLGNLLNVFNSLHKPQTPQQPNFDTNPITPTRDQQLQQFLIQQQFGRGSGNYGPQVFGSRG